MRDVPIATPVTTPVDASTVALVTSLLVHVPPLTAWVSVVVDPTQVVSEPEMGPGVLTTFTVVTTEQPPTR